MRKFLLIILIFFLSSFIVAFAPPTPPTQHGNNTSAFNNKTKQFEPNANHPPIGTATLFLIAISSLCVMLKIKRKKLD